MTPKEKRELLFRKSRPFFRRADLLTAEGYGEDMPLLWAAYKAGSFPAQEGMTDSQFAKWIASQINAFGEIWIGEDDSKSFSKGRGGVCLVGTNAQGMLVTIEGQGFKWATKRNVLRSCVAFLNMITRSAKTGVVLVKCDEKTRGLLDHMKKYRLLFYVGKSGLNEYLYSVRGRGSD
jgi:hypothetical protein